jgi:cytochrome bd-type quinol oxidase subunit 1
MAFDLEKLGQQLRNEWRDYMADFRDIIDALRHVEGWVTLGLVLGVIAVIAVWFITGLGFDQVTLVGSFRLSGRTCNPVNNVNGVLLFIDAFMMFFLGIMAIGEMLLLLDRVRKGDPSQPRQVAILAISMLVVGVFGIVYMRAIC